MEVAVCGELDGGGGELGECAGAVPVCGGCAEGELGDFGEAGFGGGDVVEVEVVSGEEGSPFGFVVVQLAELDHGEEDAVAEGLSGHLDDEFAVSGFGFVSGEAVLACAFEFALEVAGVDEACGAVAVGGPVFDGVFVDEELAEGVFGEGAEGGGGGGGVAASGERRTENGEQNARQAGDGWAVVRFTIARGRAKI